jgi:hypothetical protein
MPFYRFQVCDPFSPVDGLGHDGAALADDIDATLFAAGIIQRWMQEHPAAPGNRAVRITQDNRLVSVLAFEDGCKVVLGPHWIFDPPGDAREGEGWR